MHSLAQRVLFHIRRQEMLSAGNRVGVAVSGGIDSVALLRLLLELKHELGIVLSAVHFNHKLRGGESDADQEFVANLAHEYGLEFHVDSDDVAQRAAEKSISLEAAGRELRYGFFRHLLGEDGFAPPGLKPLSLARPDGTAEAVPFYKSNQHKSGQHESHEHDSQASAPSADVSFVNAGIHLDKILTGHTLDDQAETVLMRIIRGAGLRGLGGIYPRIVVEDDDGEVTGEIVRPLLTIRRRELERYLQDVGQAWHEDSTNADEKFTRNRVRKLVVPLLEREFNPAVAENLAELAEIARGEEDYWENEISGWLGTTVQWSQPDWVAAVLRDDRLVQIAPMARAASNSHADLGLKFRSKIRSKIDNAPWLVMNASVSRMWFLGEPIAVQRRLVKAIGDHAGIPLEFKHVEEILRVAAEDSSSAKDSSLSLPLGWKLVRRPEELVFATPDLGETAPAQDYEYELPIPGQITVYEAGSSIEARLVSADARAGYNPDHLLDAEFLPGPLKVRNWRPGDRFWPAHTKSPKKIKELLQEQHVALQARRSWPVVVSGDEIVWVRGFLSSARLRAKPGRAALLIMDAAVADNSNMED